MNLLPVLVRRVPRALRALLLVATLIVGSAAHLWHHVEDPHCGDSQGTHGDEHFCGACNNLHGGTLATGDAPDVAPMAVRWAGFAAPACSEHTAPLATAGAPRAPPAA